MQHLHHTRFPTTYNENLYVSTDQVSVDMSTDKMSTDQVSVDMSVDMSTDQVSVDMEQKKKPRRVWRGSLTIGVAGGYHPYVFGFNRIPPLWVWFQPTCAGVFRKDACSRRRHELLQHPYAFFKHQQTCVDFV